MGEARRRAERGEMPSQRGGYHDRGAEVRRLAAGMDERVRQLTSATPEIDDRELTERMVGHLPALHQIWTSTSDDTLANLVIEYPGFYRYAQAMEDAFEAERQKPRRTSASGAIEELPGSVKPLVIQALTQAATLERDLQGLVDRLQRHAAMGKQLDGGAFSADVAKAAEIGELHKRWIASLGHMADAARQAGVPDGSWRPLVEIFMASNKRIDALNDRLMAVALAGKAAEAAPDSPRC